MKKTSSKIKKDTPEIKYKPQFYVEEEREVVYFWYGHQNMYYASLISGYIQKKGKEYTVKVSKHFMGTDEHTQKSFSTKNECLKFGINTIKDRLKQIQDNIKYTKIKE